MRNALLFISIIIVSLGAAGEERNDSTGWVGGVSYTNLSEEISYISLSEVSKMNLGFGSLAGSIGYKIDSGHGFYLIPQLRIGFGINGERLYISGTTVNVELDSFLALSLRGQLGVGNATYLFIEPAYANAQFTASASGVSFTNDSWEFGFGGGAGYNFTDNISAELAYERFDGTNAVSLGLKLHF